MIRHTAAFRALTGVRPELKPGTGLGQQLNGVELRHVCRGDISHLRNELQEVVKRVRRRPHLINRFFRGANLQSFKTRSVTKEC